RLGGEEPRAVELEVLAVDAPWPAGRCGFVLPGAAGREGDPFAVRMPAERLDAGRQVGDGSRLATGERHDVQLRLALLLARAEERQAAAVGAEPRRPVGVRGAGELDALGGRAGLLGEVEQVDAALVPRRLRGGRVLGGGLPLRLAATAARRVAQRGGAA